MGGIVSAMPARKKTATPAVPSFEDDFDADGFSERDAVRFELRREEFVCRSLTLDELDRFDELVRAEDGGVSLRAFFQAVLRPEFVDSFMAMANDKENPVKTSTLVKVAGYVSREVRSGGDPKEGS